MKAYKAYYDALPVPAALPARVLAALAEKKRPAPLRRIGLPALACLALALAAVLLASPRANAPVQEVPPSLSPASPSSVPPAPEPDLEQPDFALTYNDRALVALDAAPAPGSFSRALSEKELQTLFPQLAAAHSLSGAALFLKDGTPLALSLRLEDLEQTHRISLGSPLSCLVPDGGEEDLIRSWVRGESVTACRWTSPDGALYLTAAFTRDGLPYHLELQGRPGDEALLESLVGLLLTDEAPDLAAVDPGEIPLFRNEALDWAAARADEDFGRLVPPETLAGGFHLESAWRYQDQNSNCLRLRYAGDSGDVELCAAYLTEEAAARLTSPSQRETYDLSLYPIPLSQSVPEALWAVVNDPIFQAGELNADVVRARARWVAEAGEPEGWRTELSVLYGDLVLQLRAKGAAPEDLYALLAALPAEGMA